jgi:hypothetical protein
MGNSRSIQPIDILDILLQMLPNLRKLAPARADHVQLADLSASTKVKHGETYDTDLLVGLRAAGTGPSGCVLGGGVRTLVRPRWVKGDLPRRYRTSKFQELQTC